MAELVDAADLKSVGRKAVPVRFRPSAPFLSRYDRCQTAYNLGTNAPSYTKKEKAMAKITWKPGTLEYPLPPVMVSCGSIENPNIMTAAWTGIVSSEPPMTYVSIRPSRYSHELIKSSGEFVINLTTLALVTAADYCGVKSGRDVNKFKEMKLKAGACSQVSAPQIVESPVSLECKVKDIINCGSHDMFLAEIVAVNIDDQYLDEDGKLCLEKAGLIAYSHHYYYTLGRNVGFFGFSVCKSALKAKEKMKNVVVEIKTPKITLDRMAKSKNSARRGPWGNKNKKFGSNNSSGRSRPNRGGEQNRRRQSARRSGPATRSGSAKK